MNESSPVPTPVDLRCSLCSQRAMFALTLSCCQSLICGYCTYNRHAKCLVCEQLTASEPTPDKDTRRKLLRYLRGRLDTLKARKTETPNTLPLLELTESRACG
ncbi:hypothetical protein CGCFRS4_v015823 [Colletotrichum fructicola]|nr:hypothetical protein CFRS1_v015296 [Colletotrichum fructicola]KAF4881176.1 hypothetical protein CGCFRS4_v015823 [Colletotrichum fructicola]